MAFQVRQNISIFVRKLPEAERMSSKVASVNTMPT